MQFNLASGTRNCALIHLFPFQGAPQRHGLFAMRKEHQMRNALLASTAALVIGISFASAQNMIGGGQSGNSAQTERGSAGGNKQQGRDAQRGAQEESKQPGARDKQGQSQRSEGQREQT